MRRPHPPAKLVVVACVVVGVLVGAYTVSRLATVEAGTETAGSMNRVPGGPAVDPEEQVDLKGRVTFHLWADPDTGRRFILARGKADPATLEQLANGGRYTARYGSTYNPAKAQRRVAGWCRTHGLNPGAWPVEFGDAGCMVVGRTARGGRFGMVFHRRSGRFVMRYEVR